MTWRTEGGMDLFVVTDEQIQSLDFWLLLLAFAFLVQVLSIVFAEVIYNLFSEPRAYVYRCPPEKRPPPEAFE